MWTDALGLSYLGIFFGVSIIIGYLGGAYGDRRLHTAPWLSIVGLFLGIAAGFKELLRVANQYRTKQARDEQAARARPGENDSSKTSDEAPGKDIQ